MKHVGSPDVWVILLLACTSHIPKARARVFNFNLCFVFDDNFAGNNADIEALIYNNYKSFFFLSIEAGL